MMLSPSCFVLAGFWWAIYYYCIWLSAELTENRWTHELLFKRPLGDCWTYRKIRLKKLPYLIDLTLLKVLVVFIVFSWDLYLSVRRRTNRQNEILLSIFIEIVLLHVLIRLENFSRFLIIMCIFLGLQLTRVQFLSQLTIPCGVCEKQLWCKISSFTFPSCRPSKSNIVKIH